MKKVIAKRTLLCLSAPRHAQTDTVGQRRPEARCYVGVPTRSYSSAAVTRTGMI